MKVRNVWEGLETRDPGWRRSGWIWRPWPQGEDCLDGFGDLAPCWRLPGWVWRPGASMKAVLVDLGWHESDLKAVN